MISIYLYHIITLFWARGRCHYPKYDDNVSFQGLLKFAPTS